MFSKPKSETSPSTDTAAKPAPTSASVPAPVTSADKPSTPSSYQSKPKVTPSLLSADLIIQGNVITDGDIQIEGTIEGDVHASLLTVGESAVIRGELSAEDVIVNGHVIGRLRGRKIRLAATAQVEGDIVHKTIAIEAGAQFEGSVQRQEDPLAESNPKPTVTSIKSAKATAAE